jgi:hypothetical protein
MTQKWHQKSIRRHFLDFHIPDWHPDFLSRFDPAGFAERVAAEKATAATVFANTHTGLCTYPTKAGAQHGNLRGRDLLGAMIDALHARGLDAVVYYCTIYTDWYWDLHPEARIVDAEGRSEKQLMPGFAHPRRFSTLCPNNSAYRSFVVAQLTEICTGYEFEGTWPDMTFWPGICYCHSCQERFRLETGLELPRTVNWENPVWVSFQRKRQEWLAEFAELVTSTIRNLKPGVSVAHQSHAFFGDWRLGASVRLADASDWLSADLYGEKYGLSFACKLFYGLSRFKPFEQINTWCWPNIFEHVVTRTEDEMRMTALSTMINHGAMSFIDAVDPVGTIHGRNYDTVARIYAEMAAYEAEFGGRFCQDVGIYFSYESAIDPQDNGTSVAALGHNFEPGRKPMGENPHRKGAVSLGRTLMQNHVPYGILTKKDLGHLSDWQLIVLPSAIMLDAEEISALTEYVRRGGSLLASKTTSLLSTEGVRQDTFLLADLFGCDFGGETREIVTYLCPAPGRGELLEPFTEQCPATLYDSQIIVRPREGTEILATVTLPYTDPRETRYSSILTDPPGRHTFFPSLILNKVGKGRVIYAAGPIEGWEHDSQRQVLLRLVRLLAVRPFWVEVSAPKSVEVTLFLQEDRRRYLVNVLNYQSELPNIPVHGVTLRIRMDGRKASGVYRLPGKEPVPFERQGDFVELSLERLDDFEMIAVSF